jgi:hypothetical protein
LEPAGLVKSEGLFSIRFATKCLLDHGHVVSVVACQGLAHRDLASRIHVRHPKADKPARRAIERRAIEAVNWGTPAVNTDCMYSAEYLIPFRKATRQLLRK